MLLIKKGESFTLYLVLRVYYECVNWTL